MQYLVIRKLFFVSQARELYESDDGDKLLVHCYYRYARHFQNFVYLPLEFGAWTDSSFIYHSQAKILYLNSGNDAEQHKLTCVCAFQLLYSTEPNRLVLVLSTNTK